MFTADELAVAVDGYWWLGRKYKGTASPVTDTRGDLAGKVFFAIKGERFDGHDFLGKAWENGAAAVVADALSAAKFAGTVTAGCPVLVVPDTLRAYQLAGKAHRDRMKSLTVCAVTGSVGKTATKEMLRAIFEAVAPSCVHATAGNTNNQVGVPQNLLKLTPEHRYAVIEMGTNHHGEIGRIAPLADASAAIITAIAQCHLEHLGDLHGVAFEKGHIFSTLRRDAAVIMPADVLAVDELRQSAGERRILTFGLAGSGADMELISWGTSLLVPGRVVMRLQQKETISFEWELAGKYMALDACAAALAAWAMGIATDQIASGLAATVLPGMRAKVIRHGGNIWLLDAYNANPASMEAMLNNIALSGIAERKLILVLGDMLELGEGAAEAHRHVLESAFTKFPEAKFCLVGEIFGALCRNGNFSADVTHFSKAEDVAPVLAGLENSVVALKASNGIGLVRALPENIASQV